MEALQGIGNSVQGILLGIGALGILLSVGVIFIESIIPCMPLGVFITGVFYSYGTLNGLLLCNFLSFHITHILSATAKKSSGRILRRCL